MKPRMLVPESHWFSGGGGWMQRRGQPAGGNTERRHSMQHGQQQHRPTTSQHTHASSTAATAASLSVRDESRSGRQRGQTRHPQSFGRRIKKWKGPVQYLFAAGFLVVVRGMSWWKRNVIFCGRVSGSSRDIFRWIGVVQRALLLYSILLARKLIIDNFGIYICSEERPLYRKPGTDAIFALHRYKNKTK